MGRTAWCSEEGLKKGEWTPDEDQKLVAYINEHGVGDCWQYVPQKAGLRRCGKSCRLRWLNHLKPGIKKGRFTPEEERAIIRLHAQIGNRWARIAKHMPGRRDNDIKNHWNSSLKKRSARMVAESGAQPPAPVVSPSSSTCTSAQLLNELARKVSALRRRSGGESSDVNPPDSSRHELLEYRLKELVSQTSHSSPFSSDITDNYGGASDVQGVVAVVIENSVDYQDNAVVGHDETTSFMDELLELEDFGLVDGEDLMHGYLMDDDASAVISFDPLLSND